MSSGPDVGALLALSKTAAQSVGEQLVRWSTEGMNSYHQQAETPREIKAAVDQLADQELLTLLRPAALPILSEESGLVAGASRDGYRFIVDPLDGTFNFVKSLGPCAVSVALWKFEEPVFGVIFSLTDGRLAWGGPGLGAFCDGRPIAVSSTGSASVASVCTGIPARLDLEDPEAIGGLVAVMKTFSKVRMVGSAAVALLNVAMGRADAYAERGIMLWDVAAGLAIVEGAGGHTCRTPAGRPHALNVVATNGRLRWPEGAGGW